MTELTDVSGAFGYGDSILVGERVRLRGVRDDDLATLAKWEMDPGRMTTLTNKVAPPSEAAAKERIAKWSANEKDDLGFAIETLGDPPVLVGNIGLFGVHPKDRCATIGIALGREHIGRGYGTDAMRVIVDYGFREMGLHRIQLGVAPFNPAGIRAYEKAGFVEEGRYRESVMHDGRWYDEVLMSILDHEWAARRTSETGHSRVRTRWIRGFMAFRPRLVGRDAGFVQDECEDLSLVPQVIVTSGRADVSARAQLGPEQTAGRPARRWRAGGPPTWPARGSAPAGRAGSR